VSDSAPQETLIENMDSNEPMPYSEQDASTPDWEPIAIEDLSSLTSTTVEIPPPVEDVPANQVESLSESQVKHNVAWQAIFLTFAFDRLPRIHSTQPQMTGKTSMISTLDRPSLVC
jgi:hypothetical protein